MDRLTTPVGQCSLESNASRLIPTAAAASGFPADSATSRIATRSANHTTAAASGRAARLVNQFVCMCGKMTLGRLGLSSHQRNCDTFRRTVVGPIESADQRDTAQTNLISADSLEKDTENINAAKFNLKTNNLDSTDQSQANNVNHKAINKNNNYLSADRLDNENLEFYFKSDLSDNLFSSDVDGADLINHRIAVNRPPPPSSPSPLVWESWEMRGGPLNLCISYRECPFRGLRLDGRR